MQVRVPTRGPSCRWRIPFFCGVFLFLFSTILSQGQDLAEAARQERARKATQQKAPRHVYTEEDLKRQKILTPRDQAAVEAAKKQTDTTPAQQNAEGLANEGLANEGLANDVSPQTESLGEVARRYRREKAAHESEQEARKRFTPFPYKVPEVSLAAPKPGVAPAVGNLPRLDSTKRIPPMPLSVPHSSLRGTSPLSRISPFQPRPLVVAPAAPPLAPATPVRSSSIASIARSAPGNPLASEASAGMQRVQVQRGESWWKLAERYLGSGNRWPELRNLNATANGPPELLKLGSIVLVPEKPRARESLPRRNITVRKGDSLWSLAREYLGPGSAWKCLARANPQISDYTHVAIGTTLQLPAGEALRSCQSGRTDELRK